MSRPQVLPLAAIPEFVERAELSTPERRRLYSARADALGQGAHVVLVLWEAPDWQLLAVQPPEDAAHLSTPEVLTRVGDWPGLVAEMLAKSRRGSHYTWLELQNRTPHGNAIH